jgi:AbrB family looped-hinge helix DNA binding protein
MSVVTVSSKGQVVLPKDLRKELNIQEGDRLEIRRDGEELHLRRVVAVPDAAEWRSWRGVLAGSDALADHMREHRDEIERERLS